MTSKIKTEIPGLVRDQESNALLSADARGYSTYKENRKILNNQQTLEKKVTSLSEDLKLLREILGE